MPSYEQNEEKLMGWVRCTCVGAWDASFQPKAVLELTVGRDHEMYIL